MHRLEHAALAPVLLAQAAWVVARAKRLPEAAGARTGTTGDGNALRILIVGDSSAAGVGVSRQEEALSGQLAAALAAQYRVTWRLEARTGDTSRQTLVRLRDSERADFDVAVVALGVNDATRLLPTSRWVRTGKELRALLRADFGVSRILVSDLPPLGAFPLLPQPLSGVLGRHARRLSDAQAEALAQEADTDLIRFDMPLTPDLMASDGFHPGPEVYRLWAQDIAHRLHDEGS